MRLDPNHVVVAAFRNATGDPALSLLGERVGHWVTQGLQQAAVRVTPWDQSLQSWTYVQTEAEGGRVRDPARALAQETGAGVVISGAIYVEGDSIEIQVNVTDAVRGRALISPDAVLGSREAQGALVENVTQQVLGSLAVSFDERLAGVVDVMGNAPSLEAYQAFDAGMGVYYGDKPFDAVPQFLRAAEIDPTFSDFPCLCVVCGGQRPQDAVGLRLSPDGPIRASR